MPLSDRTLAEMKAGAEKVAENNGTELDPGWLDRIVTIQDRMRVLRFWENKGIVRMERVTVPREDDATGPINRVVRRIVWVGPKSFTDEVAELNGCWPSELLIAEVTLAIDAGVHEIDGETHG
jgi:hypothetical protein